MAVLEILIILLLPALILLLAKRFSLFRRIGAVALCYACGFVLALLPIPFDKSLSQLMASILVALAIPLILFGFDLRSVRGLAKPILVGYGLQIVSAVQVGCILVHLLLCKLFRVDGGAALITNIAGIYGPPFIAPTANAWGDRNLIAPGVICGVLGLMLGNLLGIGVGALLRLWV